MLPKLIVVIIVALAIGGYFLMQKSTPFTQITLQQGSTNKWNLQRVPCEGDFFDSHAHFDGLVDEHPFTPGPRWVSLAPQDLAKRMSEHKVDCVVLFVDMTNIEVGINRMQESLADTGVGFVPFLPEYDLLPLSGEKVFFGIGEIGFYEGPLKGTSLTADPWPKIFEYAAKENLFLMFHLTEQQADDLEKMLSQYPNTKVILHGFESLNTGLVGKWLSKYKNLYFTYDLATMFDGYLYRVQNSPDFISWYDANKKQYLTSVRNRLLSLLEAAPDRVMWGTDVVANWHTEPEVYNRLMEFSKELVDSLPAQYQDNFAHANAQHLFGSGIAFYRE